MLISLCLTVTHFGSYFLICWWFPASMATPSMLKPPRPLAVRARRHRTATGTGTTPQIDVPIWGGKDYVRGAFLLLYDSISICIYIYTYHYFRVYIYNIQYKKYIYIIYIYILYTCIAIFGIAILVGHSTYVALWNWHYASTCIWNKTQALSRLSSLQPMAELVTMVAIHPSPNHVLYPRPNN